MECEDKRTGGYDMLIMGIDPGTNVMGYGIIGVRGRNPELVVSGVIRLSRFENHYQRLGRIYRRVSDLIVQYSPDEVAIEAPFFGKNVQSMLKLGRAQGVAIAAALSRDVPVAEYEPRKIKMAITGTGGASKEQVRTMIEHQLGVTEDVLPPELDATDALGAALCHYYETERDRMITPAKSAAKIKLPASRGKSSWKDFIEKNPDRVKKS